MRVYPFTESETNEIRDNLRLHCVGAQALTEVVNGVLRPTAFFPELRDAIADFQPGLIVLDPRSAFYGGDENSNPQVAQFIFALAGLTKLVQDGAAVWLTHHVSKNVAGGDNSCGRGASAGRDGLRCVLHMERLTPVEIEEAGITNEHLFVKLTNTKANYSERQPGAIYFQRDTGTTGGVLREIDMRATKIEIRNAKAERLAKALAEMIGTNPDDLSRRTILKAPEGKLMRDTLKDEFVDAVCTQKHMEDAMNCATNQGWLKVETLQVGTVKKQIPRYAGWRG